MIFKKSIIYVVLIFCNLTNSSQAQTILSVKEKTNNITSFDLSSVRRITFKDQNLNILKWNNNENNFVISNIQLVSFENATDLSSVTDKKKEVVRLYPNPVSELLNCEFDNVSDFHHLKIQIISLDGQIIVQKNTYIINGMNLITIPISELQNGVYFFRMISHNALKTIRFIKKN